jgi:hypothetical protein
MVQNDQLQHQQQHQPVQHHQYPQAQVQPVRMQSYAPHSLFNGYQTQSQSQHQQQQFFPTTTPVTPSYNHWTGYRMQSLPASTLASPVTFTGYNHPSTTHNSPIDQLQLPRAVSDSYSQVHHDQRQHSVLLTTPPRYTESQDVTTVGLGISNVHFDEHRYIISNDQLQQQQAQGNGQSLGEEKSTIYTYIEGEPELSDEDLDLDLDNVLDDSDDEFIPGKKQIKGRKSKTGKKGSRTNLKAGSRKIKC